MNWFQRYGIPGAYFIGLSLTWGYALDYCMIPTIDPRMLIALAAIIFIPIGYIISILQQWLYLQFKCLGIHRKAKIEAGIDFSGQPDDEATIEARSLLLILSKRIPLDHNRFIQDWIRRRMDVIAINFSLIVATIFSGIIFLIPRIFQWNPRFSILRIACPIAISVFVVVAAYLNIRQLKKQITEVITRIYEEYKPT
jgi:hypothetical protein